MPEHHEEREGAKKSSYLISYAVDRPDSIFLYKDDNIYNDKLNHGVAGHHLYIVKESDKHLYRV